MDKYLQFAKQLAARAGEVMLEHFQIGLEVNKDNATPVTIADTTINHLVVEAVKEKYPEHAVIGEEENYPVDGAQYVWVCDPIDGTLPYSMGLPTNVFSLALVAASDGQPVVAVVYDPYLKRLFWATKGGGAFVNGTPLHVSDADSLEDVVVASSGLRSRVVRSVPLKAALIGMCYRPLSLNCVLYEGMLLAAGQIGAQVFVGPGAYDAVTAKLIVEEAGGKVTSLFGEEQRYDQEIKGIIMSNGHPNIHDPLVALAKSFAL